jgi:hypothetical protein
MGLVGMGWVASAGAGGMGWDGSGWDGMDWDGMGWDGLGWDGLGWDGLGWDGLGWDGLGWELGWREVINGFWRLGRIIGNRLNLQAAIVYHIAPSSRQENDQTRTLYISARVAGVDRPQSLKSLRFSDECQWWETVEQRRYSLPINNRFAHDNIGSHGNRPHLRYVFNGFPLCHSLRTSKASSPNQIKPNDYVAFGRVARSQTR